MILKFQQGGSSLPPLVSYQPVTVTGGATSGATAKSESSSKGSDLTDKDLLELLGKLNGLPSDVELLTKELQNFYINDKYNPIASTASIESRYLQIMKQMQKVNFNRKEYDNAYAKVSANGGINEFAIDNHGKIVCANADRTDFKLLTVDQVMSNNEYIPLTNQELLQMRAYDKKLSFNSDILGVVQNGIGIESVTKLVNQAVTMLGTTTKQEEGYVRTNHKQLLSGLQDYIKAASNSQSYNTTIDNLYKTNMLTKSQAEQAAMAIDYVWSTLPVNAKTLLRTKTQGGTVKEAKQLITELITAKTSSTQDFNVSLETSKGKSTKGTGNGNGGDVKADPVKAFILGKGYSQPIGINVGNSYTHNVNGRYGILTDKSGNALGANSTLEDVTGSAYAGVLDMNSATFGGVQLNTNQSRRVLLDSADIIGMDLPIDQDAKSKHGIIRPDLHMLSRLEQAENDIRYGNITDPEQINAIYVKYDLPEKFKNENGSYNLNLLNYQRFARLSGVVEEAALPEDTKLDGTVQEVEDENLRSSIEQVIQSKDKDYSMSNGWWGTEVYRGAIYIPVREDLIAASLGSGEYYELSEATQAEEDWAQTQKVQGYKKPASLSTMK